MTEAEERAFEVKAEKMLKGHKQCPAGRDFRAFVFRFRDEDEGFKKRYDDTFPDSPGSEKWWKKRFGK